MTRRTATVTSGVEQLCRSRRSILVIEPDDRVIPVTGGGLGSTEASAQDPAKHLRRPSQARPPGMDAMGILSEH